MQEETATQAGRLLFSCLFATHFLRWIRKVSTHFLLVQYLVDLHYLSDKSQGHTKGVNRRMET